MRKHSAWIFELLLRVLLPARGRHRSASALPAVGCADAATLAHPRLLVGRPQERQLEHGRRRVLWLAVHGVDAGPRWIHGVEVMG